MSDAQNKFVEDLMGEVHTIVDMLIDKNKKYGDAALNPKQTFSSASPIELINVRIDDKLSRIANRQNNEDEDPELDLIGYLLIKRVAVKRFKEANEAKALKTAAKDEANRQNSAWQPQAQKIPEPLPAAPVAPANPVPYIGPLPLMPIDPPTLAPMRAATPSSKDACPVVRNGRYYFANGKCVNCGATIPATNLGEGMCNE